MPLSRHVIEARAARRGRQRANGSKPVAVACPGVPTRTRLARKGTRLVPAKRPIVVAKGNNVRRFAGFFAKPSDGLEPSTPSLPFRFCGGTRGHARVAAGTKAPQAGGI